MSAWTPSTASLRSVIGMSRLLALRCAHGCALVLAEEFEIPMGDVIDAAELKGAQNDPRVRSFHKEADAYLDELERQGRDR